MKALDVLPADLRSRSLSPREPVFVLEDAVVALRTYGAVGWAQLGWETWLKYPDGKHSHAPTPTLDLRRGASETWRDFVERTRHACEETIPAAQREWEADNPDSGSVLYFCLTPVGPE